MGLFHMLLAIALALALVLARRKFTLPLFRIGYVNVVLVAFTLLVCREAFEMILAGRNIALERAVVSLFVFAASRAVKILLEEKV